MNKIVRKFSLIICGVILSLIAVELLLRLSGRIYYQKWMRKEQEVVDAEKDFLREGDKNLYKIVCIGDSFTFGLGTTPGYSYPAQLQRILNKEKGDYIVKSRNGKTGQIDIINNKAKKVNSKLKEMIKKRKENAIW